MKNSIIKKILALRQTSADRLRDKKNIIQARSEKLDPNNKEIQQQPLIKSEKNRKIHDDGFEHRSSKETTTPI